MALRGKHITDEALMLRFQRGEVSAFAELVQRYKSPLYSFVVRHIRSNHAAEDVLQDVFLRVIQSCNDFKHEARFSTWAFTIARNLCIDHLRKMALRNHDSFEQPRTLGASSVADQTSDPAPSGSVERSALANELRLQIVDAIDHLPDEQREVFLLREVANLPFKEIAKITGIPENTVKSRMRYALERLQDALGDYEDEARATR